ncbi:MAG: tetratricopeptide repeat protein [Lachnospiraceae bacterium]|nr:tetratricopeptide repeat protein [Lachnospiraceae bacterium]
MNCLHCGAPVLINDVCSVCGLKQEYLIKAWNTSLYYYNQGLEHAKIRNLTGAEEALKTALRYNKANIDARNLLGLVYYETGQVVEALAEWVISSNYQPEENPALRYLKVVQGNQNKLSAFDQAAKKYNLTLHYVRQKDHDLALIQLKRVLNANPHFVKAYLILALIYMQDGNVDKAKKALQRVLKIDKFNPMAQHYLAELGKNERQYSTSMSADTVYEEDELPEMEGISQLQEETEEELDGEETARRKIREIIERGAAAEDINSEQNLEVGSYKEIKYGRHNVLYLVSGLAIGIAAMFFLIMPARMKRIKNENLELKSSYSAELAGKNSTIDILQGDNEKLQADLDALNAQLENITTANSAGSMNDTVMTGIQAYMSGDKQGAITSLGTVDLTDGALSEASRTCIQTIVNDCSEELAACRSAGMTAFGAENYTEAITQLQVFCNLKPDDAEARYNLAKAYENVGNIEAATALYQDINTRFPDSEYVTTMYQ